MHIKILKDCKIKLIFCCWLPPNFTSFIETNLAFPYLCTWSYWISFKDVLGKIYIHGQLNPGSHSTMRVWIRLPMSVWIFANFTTIILRPPLTYENKKSTETKYYNDIFGFDRKSVLSKLFGLNINRNRNNFLIRHVRQVY